MRWALGCLALYAWAALLAPLGALGQASEGASGEVTPDKAFSAFVDRYIDGLFHFEPARGTRAGFHQYDSELPAYSRQEVEAEIARTKHALAELTEIRSGKLSKENQFDARLLEGSIRGHTLDLESIRQWEKDPNFYNEAVSRALFVLIERDFAPVDVRLKSLLAREGRVPEVLESARQNLTNPPGIYTNIAIRQATSELDFLKNELPRAVSGTRDAALQAPFREANKKTIEAYERFLQFLRDDVAPRSHGSFSIGTENFTKKLLDDEMVSTPLEQLLAIGERELRKTQEDFKSTAALIDPANPPAKVLEELSRDHPDAQHLIPESQAVLENLRRFVVSHGIAAILSDQDPRVVETPTFMRVLTFASMDSPGPFEENSAEAFYNVTLPDPDWDPDRKEQLLRFFNHYAIPGTSIHEVFPGHYTQFLWIRRMPTKVRKLVGSSSNAEGWAHYAEQMMLEQGYGEGDPKLLLFQLQAALMRLCRYIVAIRMHTRGMTLEEAIEFFKREGYMEQANAEREAMRGTADPGYLAYTLGKLEILKLRGDYKKKMGDRFQLKQFHDRFLSYGYPPIPMIRREMLGNSSPAL